MTGVGGGGGGWRCNLFIRQISNGYKQISYIFQVVIRLFCLMKHVRRKDIGSHQVKPAMKLSKYNLKPEKKTDLPFASTPRLVFPLNDV